MDFYAKLSLLYKNMFRFGVSIIWLGLKFHEKKFVRIQKVFYLSNVALMEPLELDILGSAP